MTHDVETLTGRLLKIDDGACSCCSHATISVRNGQISSIAELVDQTAESDGSLWMPPIANAHDHIRGLKPISLGAYDMPLEMWLTSMSNIPKVDPYLIAVNALGRQMRGGVGTVMIHYTRPNNADRVVAELEVVARAAEDLGVRVAVAVSLRDMNPLGYGPDTAILADLSAEDQACIREKLIPDFKSVEEQLKQVDDLADRIDSPYVTVQYGPYGMEWCSRALLEGIAKRSAETGRRVHMHLLESPVQRAYVDSIYPEGPITYLKTIGLLSERLSVAHATQITPGEMELLAEAGVVVSSNLTSNLGLHNGTPPVGEMLKRGVRLAFGLDGMSLDDDDDAFREIRLNQFVHGGVGLEPGLRTPTLLNAACNVGRFSVSGRKDTLGVGEGLAADLMEIDYRAVSRGVFIESDPASLVVQRATAHMMKRMIIAGKTVVQNGQLTRVDQNALEAEMDAQVRFALPAYKTWRETADRLSLRLRAFYSAGFMRCG